MLKQNFTIRSYSYRQSVNATIAQGCYGWIAINYSDTTVWVNEIPLLPALAPGLLGQSFGFMDNRGGYYKGDIKIVFDAAVTIPLLVLVQIMDVE